MNKQEAYIILGLNDGADQTEINSKFQEIYSDYQIRLSNAPTPNLKKLYQKNLQELEDAYHVLLGNENTSSELPSSTPQLEVKKPVERKNPEAIVSPTAQAKTPSFQSPDKAPAAPSGSSKKGMLIGGLLGLIGLGAAVLFGLLYFQMQKESDTELAKIKAEQDKQAEAIAEAEVYKKVFKQEKFKIKNTGSKNLNIMILIATYMNDKQELEKKEYYVGKTLESGKTYDAMIVTGSRTEYDGSVISYALTFKYDGYEYTTGGIYSQDAADGTLKINMD